MARKLIAKVRAKAKGLKRSKKNVGSAAVEGLFAIGGGFAASKITGFLEDSEWLKKNPGTAPWLTAGAGVIALIFGDNKLGQFKPAIHGALGAAGAEIGEDLTGTMNGMGYIPNIQNQVQRYNVLRSSNLPMAGVLR